jgi:hypothetical protein
VTTTEPATHYTPSPAGSLVGDTLVACGTAHWGIVSGDLAQVTCEPCKAAAPGFQHLTAALAARAKTSVNNPLRPHVGALTSALAAALAYHQPRPLRNGEVISWSPTPAGPVMVCLSCRDDAGETTQWPCPEYQEITAALRPA